MNMTFALFWLGLIGLIVGVGLLLFGEPYGWAAVMTGGLTLVVSGFVED